MKKIILMAFSALILTSCKDFKNLSKAGNLIAEYCGSTNITISTAYYTDTKNGSVDSYEIQIKDAVDINNGNYPPEYLASVSAKTLYDNLNQEEKDDRDLIVVIIETPDKKFEYKYSIEKLSKVDFYLTTTREFILKIARGDSENLTNYLNNQTIDIQEFEKEIIKGKILRNDTLFKKINAIDLHCINFSLENELKMTELITFGEIGDGHIKFSTRFIDEKPEKISGITIY
ncbi:hypothetical protein [Flavobacterium sp.]|uniref:hypothetical protein n=1 Tax=Flavobacterium sp. TaxID=239 RepID=UPI004048C469